MDEQEAESAGVIFDHFNDEHLPDETKRFKVKRLVSTRIRTKHAKDFDHLDFSVLALESEDKFLDENDTKEIFTDLRSSAPKFVPIIAFHCLLLDPFTRDRYQNKNVFYSISLRLAENKNQTIYFSTN